MFRTFLQAQIVVTNTQFRSGGTSVHLASLFLLTITALAIMGAILKVLFSHGSRSQFLYWLVPLFLFNLTLLISGIYGGYLVITSSMWTLTLLSTLAGLWLYLPLVRRDKDHLPIAIIIGLIWLVGIFLSSFMGLLLILTG